MVGAASADASTLGVTAFNVGMLDEKAAAFPSACSSLHLRAFLDARCDSFQRRHALRCTCVHSSRSGAMVGAASADASTLGVTAFNVGMLDEKAFGSSRLV